MTRISSSDRIAMPRLVLDTNVVFDWLVFRNPASLRLMDFVVSERLQWVYCEEMLEEALTTLGRGLGVVHAVAPEVVRTRFMDHGTCVPASPLVRWTPVWRCTDTDDQKFLDLARSQQAHYLVSRDKAVLKLARKALPTGLVICTPERAVALCEARLNEPS